MASERDRGGGGTIDGAAGDSNEAAYLLRSASLGRATPASGQAGTPVLQRRPREGAGSKQGPSHYTMWTAHSPVR